MPGGVAGRGGQSRKASQLEGSVTVIKGEVFTLPVTIKSEVGVVKLERCQVICPACGQQIEAVARDGRVKGYCAVARQYVDFTMKFYHDPEYRAKQSAAAKKLWQDPEYRAKRKLS